MDTLALTAKHNFEEKYTDEEGTMHEQILKEKDACCNEFQEPVNFEEISRNYQSYVMTTFKNDYLLTLEDKINFSTSLALYHGFLHNIEEFFEEECHFTLISWMDKYIREIKNETADEKVFQLLYNIILIFEIIPIKVADLFELKIFTKLNKIRKYIKNKLYIYHHLDKLINYWTNFCSENYVLYGKKRCRMEEENFPEISDEDFKNFANPKKKVNFNDNKLYTPVLVNLIKTDISL